MHKLLVGLVFAVFAAHPAPAPDETAVMLPVHQFVDAFNKGDVKGATEVCSNITSIIDEFPPYEWHGAGTCRTWLNAYDADAKRNGISAGFVTLAAPRHVDIILEHAYVVVPADYEYTMKLADRYRIERELGAGGMATVYLAHDLKHDRDVAIKVLAPELAAVIGADRFLAEIKTTANLQHPHILSLFDSGTVDGTVFYVMPFVDGESLRDRLTREKQLPIDDAVRIATRGRRRAALRASATASSIATSSRRTSCCRAATRWSPTSASRSPPRRPAAAA